MPDKIYSFLIVIGMCSSHILYAQKETPNLSLSASYWYTGTMNGESASACLLWKKSIFHLNHTLGFGLHLNHLREADMPYTTATPMLLKGGSGPDYWFKPFIPSNMDTIYVGKNQHYSMNLYFHFETYIGRQLSVGCHIDAIGFSFGKRRNALLYYGDDGDYFSRYTPASPTSLNMNWPGAAKIGTGQLELYLKYKLNSQWSASFGLIHQVSEYSVLEPVIYVNSRNVNINTARYRASTNGGKISLCYNLRNTIGRKR